MIRLIDANALLKSLKSGCENCSDANTNWCEHCCKINDFEDLIDNAPTIEYPFYKEAYQTGYEEGKNERPQGEWIEYKEDNEIRFFCSICQVTKGQAVNNFCACCGADMRGEKNEYFL